MYGRKKEKHVVENWNLTFAEQVDAVLSGKYSRYNDIKVCDTPEILIQAGMQQLPMLYTQAHLRKALEPKDSQKHTHGLSIQQMKDIPTLLESPTMIVKSSTRSDSYVLILDSYDVDDSPIVTTVMPNGKGTYQLKVQDSNFITSIYGRDNFENYIHKNLKENNILYCNKEKSQKMFSVLGLQFPEGFNNFDFNKIIYKIDENVKDSSLNNSFEKERKMSMEDKKKLELEDDFTKAYTQFLVDELGEDGERIAKNDLEERNPDRMKQRLNEMLDVIGGEDSSYITDDIQATVNRLNQQIDQFADVPTQNIAEQVQNLKDSFEQETGEDITDWKIGQISDEELSSMLANGQTQELQSAINELREAGLSSGLDTLRLNTLDSIRRIEDDSPVRAVETREQRWNIVHEMDDDNGNPTEWSTKINDSFIWIDKTDNGFEVHDTPNPSDRPLETLTSLDEAKEWVAEEYSSNTRGNNYMENYEERYRALAKDIFDKTYLTIDLPEEQEDALLNTSEFIIEDIYNDLTTGKIGKQLNNVNETISAYHASLEKLPSEDNSLREVYKEKIKEAEELLVELKNLDTEKDIVVIDNTDCIKVDEWQTSMGTIVLGNDISDPTENNFYLAQIGTVNAEFYGKPTREEVEDYFINELGQRELDMKEAGMNQEERKDSLSKLANPSADELTKQIIDIIGFSARKDRDNLYNEIKEKVMSFQIQPYLNTLHDIELRIESKLESESLYEVEKEEYLNNLTDIKNLENSLSDYEKNKGENVSQIETDSPTPMKQALNEFDNAYINANGSMPLQDINDCIMTNNLEKLLDSIVEFQDMDVRKEISSLAVETAEKIENMAYDGDLTLEEQRQIIIASLTEDKFSESMDGRLNYVLDIYGAKDVADDIMLVTTVGATPLSYVEVAADNDGFKFHDDDSGLTFIFNGDDIAEVVSDKDNDLVAKNDPIKKPIFYNDDLTVSDLSGENGDGIMLRYFNDKQGFDLAIWRDEDGKGQFAFADAGCLDAFLSESVDGDIIAMGQLPSQYGNMKPIGAANLIAEECIGESLDKNYRVMYLSDTISDISIPTNDPVKLPVQAEFHNNDETHTVCFMDEGAAEHFSEIHLDIDHIGVDDVSVDIGVRSMSDSDLDKMMESVIDNHAYGTDDHGYVSFEFDRDNNKVTATKYDHELTPVAQEKISFAGKKDFAVETTNFSPLTFMEKHTENPVFDGIKTLSWVDTEQFMFDVSEHEKSVRGAVEKFDSLEQQFGKYDVIFRDDDGKIVTVDSIDSIDDFSEYIAPATGTFEVQEAGKLIVKGDIDDNMRDIIGEAISEDTDSISLDKERAALELDRPVSEQEIAHAISEILYAHSDKDISLDEIEADILLQIEAAHDNPDRLDSIIDRLDNIYENEHPTLEESVKIYTCEERLNSIKDETQLREQERDIESRGREIPAKTENSFQSVGDILKSGLPQAEADIEISKLLKAQGRADDFIQSVQLMSHCEPDIAMQMADAGMVKQEQIQQKGFPQQDDLVTKQQNPLNKVEELVEGNYNQIDGIINNLPSQAEEKKPSLKETVEHKKEIIQERNYSDKEEKEETTEKTTKSYTQEI